MVWTPNVHPSPSAIAWLHSLLPASRDDSYWDNVQLRSKGKSKPEDVEAQKNLVMKEFPVSGGEHTSVHLRPSGP